MAIVTVKLVTPMLRRATAYAGVGGGKDVMCCVPRLPRTLGTHLGKAYNNRRSEQFLFAMMNKWRAFAFIADC